jgi:uncharacterized protein (TIGR02118 family)
MHKLVILIEESEAWEQGEERWPDFLHNAERMPGLRRESISQVEHFLFGDKAYVKMHELFFDSRSAVEEAMSSHYGRAAGELLQRMTDGRMTLFIADHKEDEMTNIRKYQSPEPAA